jgi:uncharacterized membrane protein required for colicin V production
MLNLFDFVVAATLVIFFCSGLFQGAIRLMLGNISFVISIALSYFLFPSAQKVVAEHVEHAQLATAIAGSIGYIISIVLCSLTFSKIKAMIKPMCGGAFDKMAGCALGALNGWLVVLGFFTVLIVAISGQRISAYDSSQSFTRILKEQNNPIWLEESSSFHILRNNLCLILKLPQIDKLFFILGVSGHNKISGRSIASDNQEGLDQQINQFLDDGQNLQE